MRNNISRKFFLVVFKIGKEGGSNQESNLVVKCPEFRPGLCTKIPAALVTNTHSRTSLKLMVQSL